MKEKTYILNLMSIIVICLVILVILFAILFMWTVSERMEDIQDSLYRCKLNGYDGIKFKSRFSSEVVCSNFSVEEKIARGIKQD